MLTCADGEWLRGMQFITNMGRCSVIYGSLEGVPAISRSKGGILVGLTTSTKKHPEWDYLVTSVNVSTSFLDRMHVDTLCLHRVYGAVILYEVYLRKTMYTLIISAQGLRVEQVSTIVHLLGTPAQCKSQAWKYGLGLILTGFR
jgi:hypothetical protein